MFSVGLVKTEVNTDHRPLPISALFSEAESVTEEEPSD